MHACVLGVRVQHVCMWAAVDVHVQVGHFIGVREHVGRCVCKLVGCVFEYGQPSLSKVFIQYVDGACM